MNGYTLDTNAIIYYAQGDEAAVQTLDSIFAEHTFFKFMWSLCPKP